MGQDAHYLPDSLIFGSQLGSSATDAEYGERVDKIELYIWVDKQSSSNPFTLTQAVDNAGALVDLSTVSTGHLYTWAHTLGSVNERSEVQRVDNMSEASGPYQLWMYMLDTSGHAPNPNGNYIASILMYDTHDAWSGGTTENGIRVSYTLDESKHFTTSVAGAIGPWDVDISAAPYSPYNEGSEWGYYGYSASYASDNPHITPIIKLGNGGNERKKRLYSIFASGVCFQLQT